MLICLLLLKCTHLIYLSNVHSINTFNYMWFENLWKHTWIKLLELTLSSYVQQAPTKICKPCFKCDKS